MSFAEVERIVERYDAAMAGLDQEVADRIGRSLDAAYRALEQELRRLYPTWASQGSLFAVQRRLLLLEELGDLLAVVRPELRGEYERLLTEALQIAHVNGGRMADELTRARDPGYPLQEFTSVPIEAAIAQARDGVNRLYRYNDDFRATASGIVEQGLIQGWGAGKVATQLRQQLGVGKSKAETIARTEVMSAFNTAAQERYQRVGIQYVQWIAAPSEASCSYCLERNGKVYEIGAANLPAHPRCRCSWASWSPRWQELGLTDDAAVTTARNEAIARFEAQGGRLNAGPTSWEKRAGLTEAPRPFWTPGS